ncbi:MAG: cobalamin-binding protein [Endozoicomonas sp.]
MKQLLFFLRFSLFATMLVHSAQALSSESKTLCVTDDLQHKVCVDQPVKRVISLAPGTTELAFAAGGGKKLVAVDDHSDYPSAVQNIPRIGGYPNVSAEAIVAMKPDLVLAWSGGNDSRLTGQLEKLGLTLFHSDPIDYDGIASVIRRLGKTMGTESQAEASARAFEKRYQSILSQYSSAEPVRVFFEIWNEPLMTVNGNQIISKTIELCGGVNIFADASVRVPRVGIESVLAADPQAIVSSRIVQGGSGIESRWQRWGRIHAVKNNHLFTIEGDLITRPTPRALDGAEILCQQLQTVRMERARKEASGQTELLTQGKH